MPQIILLVLVVIFCLGYYLIISLIDFFKHKSNRRKVQIKKHNHFSTSLGLLCQSAKKCDNESCKNGKKYGDFTCKNCIGISDEVLWIKKCEKCNNSRLVKKTIGKCQKCEGTGFLPYGSHIQVADTDFPEMMEWFDARNACSSLGNGWRLPTKNELCGMYILHKKGKGKFKKDKDYDYWSEETRDIAFSFADGQATKVISVYSTGRVRAVRTLP
jgi:hypothetical protein